MLCKVKKQAFSGYYLSAGGVRTATAMYHGEKIKKCHLHTHLGRAKVKRLYITTRLLQLKYDARCTKMGIKNLLPLLKDVSKKKHLKDFHGETAAIDASCWLHKALSVSYNHYGDDSR
jgi:hypothetical protein